MLADQLVWRMLGSAIAITLIALTRHPAALVLLLVASVLAFQTAALTSTWRRMIGATVIIGLIGLSLAFAAGWLTIGQAAPSNEPWTTRADLRSPASWRDEIKHAVYLAIIIVLKSVAIISWVRWAARNASLSHIIHAFARIGLPDKLCWLIFLVARSISLLGLQLRRIRQAMLARGVRWTFSSRSSTNAGLLVGQVLIRSHERSERMLAAMKARGWADRSP